MINQYLLPVVEHLLEDEVDAELRLRKQTVDRRENLEDKKRLLRRLVKEDKDRKIGYEGIYKFSEEIEKVSGTINELVSSLRKRADRAQVSRLRHYLIRVASASVVDKEEEMARNDVCVQIEGVLKDLRMKIRENEEDGQDTDDSKGTEPRNEEQREKTKDPKPVCLSGVKGAKCNCAWCGGKGAKSKDLDQKPKETKHRENKHYPEEVLRGSDKDRKSKGYRNEEERKERKPKYDRHERDDRETSRDRDEKGKGTRKSRRERDRHSSDDSCTGKEDRRRDSRRGGRRKTKHRQRRSDSESESESDSDVSRERRSRRNYRRGGSGRRHRRRSSSSSSQESNSGRNHYRKSRVENWNLFLLEITDRCKLKTFYTRSRNWLDMKMFLIRNY